MKENESLIQSLKTDDSSADTKIIHKYNSRLFTYFRSRIKGVDNYDDLVQEVFVSFFTAVKKDKISGDEFIAPFIFGIARNVVYNYFYKKKKAENIAKKAENEHNPFINFSGEDNLQNDRMIQLINKYIEKLKDVDRTILKEFYVRENTISEISVLLKRTKHYISVRKERALKKIKSEILRSEDIFK